MKILQFKFDRRRIERANNEMLITAKINEIMKAAGVPVLGILTFRGVTAGALAWIVDEDLDGHDTIEMWWFEDPAHANFKSKLPAGFIQVRGGDIDGHRWYEFSNVKQPQGQDDDDL